MVSSKVKTTNSRLVWDSGYPLTLYIVDEIEISDPIPVMQCFYRNSIVSLKQPTSNGNLALNRPFRLDLTASLEATPPPVHKK